MSTIMTLGNYVSRIREYVIGLRDNLATVTTEKEATDIIHELSTRLLKLEDICQVICTSEFRPDWRGAPIMLLMGLVVHQIGVNINCFTTSNDREILADSVSLNNDIANLLLRINNK